MRRPLMLLIVMTLAGAPVGSLACDWWCGTPAAANHHEAVGCHKTPTEAANVPRMSAAGDCADDLDLSPFLLEARKTDLALVDGVLATFETSSLVDSVERMFAVWGAVLQERPPRGPAFHAILRV